MRRSLQGLVLGAAGLVAVTATLSSCKRSSSVAKDAMFLLPRDTGTIITINLPRARESALWRKLLDARDRSPEMKERFAEFTSRSGLDPFTQLDAVTVGLSPAPSGDFGLLLRGTFRPAKMVEWMRGEVEKQGRTLETEEYQKLTLYSASGRDDQSCFLDERTMLVASRAWMHRMVDQALGNSKQGSAHDNPALVTLVSKVRKDDALWVVGEVSEAGRKRLGESPALRTFDGLKDYYGSLDMDRAGGLRLEVSFRMGAEDKASAGLGAVQGMLADAKKNPQLAALDLLAHIDKIKTSSQKDMLQISMSYNQLEVEKLIERLKVLFESLGVEVNPTLPSP